MSGEKEEFDDDHLLLPSVLLCRFYESQRIEVDQSVDGARVSVEWDEEDEEDMSIEPKRGTQPSLGLPSVRDKRLDHRMQQTTIHVCCLVLQHPTRIGCCLQWDTSRAER